MISPSWIFTVNINMLEDLKNVACTRQGSPEKQDHRTERAVRGDGTRELAHETTEAENAGCAICTWGTGKAAALIGPEAEGLRTREHLGVSPKSKGPRTRSSDI